MGYSSSSSSLLRALAYVDDGRALGDQEFQTVSLSAHLNPYDQPGDYKNHRVGVLQTVSGGVGPQGEFIADSTVKFEPINWSTTKTFTNVSAAYGTFSTSRVVHFFTDQIARIRFGPAGVVATLSSYPVMANTVYPFYPSGTTTYIGVIRESVNGNIYIGYAG